MRKSAFHTENRFQSRGLADCVSGVMNGAAHGLILMCTIHDVLDTQAQSSSIDPLNKFNAHEVTNIPIKDISFSLPLLSLAQQSNARVTRKTGLSSLSAPKPPASALPCMMVPDANSFMSSLGCNLTCLGFHWPAEPPGRKAQNDGHST